MSAAPPRLRALLVDDERLARAELRRLLAPHAGIEVAGEAGDANEARLALAAVAPDVVFLDIQMPGGTGFDALENVPAACRVVFVTAYSEFALRAFDANALDYLLKPVRPERLAETVARLTGAAPSAAPPPSRGALHPDDPLIFPSGTSWRVVRVKEIALLKAAKDYSEATTRDGRTTLVTRSLRDWEATLPPRQFLRVHRSTIVNLDLVERIEPWFRSSYRLALRGVAEPVEVSRRCAGLLRDRIP